MNNPAKLRVIQWATGGVGKAAIECVLNHPDLEPVGCWVHSADKNGVDVGELVGVGPLGVTATTSVDEVLALDADCVVYSPLIPHDDEVEAILRSGKNVVTPVGWVYPDPSNPRHQAIADAAREAGVTLHGSGIHPGGITERFPLMISSLSSAITHVRAEEFSDIRTYNAPEVVRHIMGFGGTPEEAMQGPMAGLLASGFKMSVRMIADHMGFRIDPNIRTLQEIAVATRDIDYGPFPLPPGTVAARRFRWQALADGEPVITAAVNWLMGEADLDPAWDFGGHGERFEVEITGDPTVHLTFKGLQPPSIAEGLERNPGVVATANHCVNAIPVVCAAEPGIKTYRDLPLFAGRPTPSLTVGHRSLAGDTVTNPGLLPDVSFCHLVIGVTDMDRALRFYRDVIGMDIVFETLISGEPFDAVLHASRNQEGRVAGGLLGGLMVELLSLGANPPTNTPARRAITGIHNLSLSVPDLDDAHHRISAAGYRPDQEPFEIGGVRMFFVKDPDGTPIEFIELPGGVRSTYEMHRGVALQMGPDKAQQ